MEELKILEEKDNPLFKRKEVSAETYADIAPKREEILKILSEKFSVPEENIKILGIAGNFGSKTFAIKANIYNSKEDKDSTEIKKKIEIEAEKKATEAKTAKETSKTEEKQEVSAEKIEETPEPVKEESPQEKTEEKTE